MERKMRAYGLHLLLMIGLWIGSADAIDNTCSDLQYLVCHEDADCVEKDGEFDKCVCRDGLEGDGLKPVDGEDHSGCGPKKCMFDHNCAPNAHCDDYQVCKCDEGYDGDANVKCDNVNECNHHPCHTHASCVDTPGSYECTCDKGYVGDGVVCSHMCSMDYECRTAEKCVAGVCVCKDGFEPVGDDCVDINECDENPCDVNAVCNNTEGAFTCTCKNGYAGNGEVCKVIPRNCHDIITALPKSNSGSYDVDPDGTGPSETITVECEMRPGLGITIIRLLEPKAHRVTKTKPHKVITYENELHHIRAIVGTSGFCYQYMSFKARFGAKTMGEDSYWMNGAGTTERNWGGAQETGSCACGDFGYCLNPDSKCNADGTIEEDVYDTGKIINKEKLPINEYNINPERGFGEVAIGPVMCSSKPFDIPIDCHDARFNKYYLFQNDGPQVLDFDGPEGPLPPILAHCDMTTYKHVGITIIPHKSTGYVTPGQPGEFSLNYNIGGDHLDKLVEISQFCSQDAEYECTNSRLMNNGDRKGFFADTRGHTKNYWPGGLGEANMCACGLTETCASSNYGCNCDVKDGKTRKDFGKVINKDDLPIGAITLKEIGGESTGQYKVGPLMCSQREFGIAATCRDFVAEGFTYNYTYLIDPDGPEDSGKGQLPPFPVVCRFIGDPLYAITVVYHQWLTQVAFINIELSFHYIRATIMQIEALVTRSVSCTQSVTFTCNNAPIHAGGKSRVKWTSRDGGQHSYFAGDGTKAAACVCGQTKPSSCVDGMECNCDAGGSSHDFGLITNKDVLPVMNMTSSDFTGSESFEAQIGPLECQEMFPNCADMKVFNKKFGLVHENEFEDGEYLIDPDGAEGVEPFVVTCTGSRTILPVDTDPDEPTDGDPDNGVSKCYQFNYKSPSGKPVSPEQVQQLVLNSKFCTQSLTQECLNAPLTDHTTFKTCDGVQQTGWAGSKGEDMCACGVTGTCEGGSAAKCNCDTENGELLSDTGSIVDQNRLAVCEVCVSLNSTSSLTSDPKIRRVKPTVSPLVCDVNPIGRGTSCQNWRDQGMTESGSLMIDVDGKGQLEPFPTYCVLYPYPPTGWTEIYPKEPEIVVPPEGVNITIEYFVFEMEFIVTLIEKSGYCTQDIWLECEDSSFSLTDPSGWYDRNGNRQDFVLSNDQVCSAEGECQCKLGKLQIDGGLIVDDKLLPIMRVVLGPTSEASGYRKLKVGPVKCFDLYKDCEDIRKNRAKTNPLGNHTYAVDPDQAGGVEPFAVVCDFKTTRNIGITVIKVIKEEDRIVIGMVPPRSLLVPVEYDSVTYDQIHALAMISGYCHQGMSYVCYNSPLTNLTHASIGYYKKYGGLRSSSFGVAGDSSVDGCACKVLNTCPVDQKCHCDATGEKMTIEYGNEIDRNALPVTQMEFGGQEADDASALYAISDVRCAPKPFDLPVDCEDAHERGFRSGEHLILPASNVEPYLVYCDMKIVKKGGVAIIGHDREVRTTVTYDETVEIKYYNVEYLALKALVEISSYCYQPFKYECKKTKLLSGLGYFYWQGGMPGTETYVGAGHYYTPQCNCGRDGYCGGSENITTLTALNRPCNCDAADDEDRADAGVFNSTTRLPMKDLTFKSTGFDESTGHVTVGKLYCAQQDFDLNECKIGFHDCHIHAKCINTFGSYECQCLPGWQGYGRDDNLWANGRNCYDDDECALNYCPWSADCTNLPGTFECVCREGFTQIGKRRCLDIDECELGTHNCHKDARCINVAGSYECRCKPNYRGNGTSCEPLALCACFGDPHCITSDGVLIDYQGKCQYVMSRDNCDDLGSTPTFEVLTTFTSRGGSETGVSWVKEVTLKIFGYTIELMQNNEVRVNGIRSTYFRNDDIVILQFGRHVEVHTNIGLELKWDGEEVIELYTPGDFGGKTCGLCGNYNGNKTDDIVVGPQCPDNEREITTSFQLFGESWGVPEYIEQHPECSANCSGTEEPELCEGLDLPKAKLVCHKIYAMDGPFKECLVLMSQEEIDIYHYSCMYDTCHTEGDVEKEVCEAAEFLENICRNQYGVIVTKFRTKEFCEVTCDENMVYESCGSTYQRNCLDVVTGETATMSTFNQCQEGCFCKEGYVRDGDSCIREEECGCYHKRQYYQVGDEIMNGPCTEKVVCLENGTMSKEDVECHELAECELRDGFHGCHCPEDHYGDGVESCTPDPCTEEPCGENEMCVRTSTVDVGYVCECAMGFIGDCGNCTEIDECKTATDDCPARSKCVNTIGSYKCECEEGYYEYSGRCTDINECELARISETYICGNNSACTNKIGTYECPCCVGYEKDENDNCVESSTPIPESEEGPRCCVCDRPICDEPGKVCGEDGIEYDSIRDMIISSCERGLPPRKYVQVDYKGRCRATCNKVDCPMYQECFVVNGQATCKCNCTEEERKQEEPVCASNLVIYKNFCEFKMLQCHFDTENTVINSMIPCEGKGQGKPVGPWSEWSECSVTCGKGVSTKTREERRAMTEAQKDKYPLSVETDCYGPPCPDGPCDVAKPCDNIAEECIVNEDGEKVCECPTCENQFDPICGYVVGTHEGVSEGSYQSACHLQKFVCKRGYPDYEVMHKGACGEEPLNCTRVPYSDYVTDENDSSFVSEEKINMFDCDGGCGKLKKYCCQPSDSEELPVTLSNGDDTKQKKVRVIKECECVDITHPVE